MPNSYGPAGGDKNTERSNPPRSNRTSSNQLSTTIPNSTSEDEPDASREVIPEIPKESVGSTQRDEATKHESKLQLLVQPPTPTSTEAQTLLQTPPQTPTPPQTSTESQAPPQTSTDPKTPPQDSTEPKTPPQTSTETQAPSQTSTQPKTPLQTSTETQALLQTPPQTPPQTLSRTLESNEEESVPTVGHGKIIFIIIFSILFPPGDLVLDILNIEENFRTYPDMIYLYIIPILAIAVPTIFLCAVNIRWYRGLKSNNKRHRSIWWNILVVVFSVLSLSAAMRSIEAVIDARKNVKALDRKKKRERLNDFKDEHNFAMTLAMYEAIFENVPQLAVNWYIVFYSDFQDVSWIKYAGICASTFTVASSIAAYKDSNRKLDPAGCNLECVLELIFSRVWRVFEIGPRVVAITLFFQAAGLATATPCVLCHILLMFIWIKSFQHRTKPLDTGNCLFHNLRLAFIAVGSSVAFINAQDRATRKTAVIFYSIFYVESFTMILLWYLGVGKDMWWKDSVLGVLTVSMVPMVGFKLIYYKWIHPKSHGGFCGRDKRNGRIEDCLPWAFYWNQCYDPEAEYTERKMRRRTITLLEGRTETENVTFTAL